jgi:hypothetical protein
MVNAYLPYILPLFIVVMIGLRMARSMRGRPINPSYLWIRPAIFALLLVPLLAFSLRPEPLEFAALALALALGAGAGYLLSRHQQLSLENGKIISKTSPVGVILFVVLYAARFVFRMQTVSGQAPGKLTAHGAQISFYSNLAFAFLIALIAAQAWEIWRRSKPLMAQKAALADKPAPEPAAD